MVRFNFFCLDWGFFIMNVLESSFMNLMYFDFILNILVVVIDE